MPKPIVSLLEAAAIVVLAGTFSAASAAGGPIYHYVTDDGTYAFTDDKKKVPARYEAGVQVRPRRPLGSYKRFTPAETAEVQIGEAVAPAQAPGTVYQYAPGNTGTSVSIRTGGSQSPMIDITPEAGDEQPVVIEKRRFKVDGADVTTTYTIVRQGDRILTVIKPQPHETNVSDFEDPEDFRLDD